MSISVIPRTAQVVRQTITEVLNSSETDPGYELKPESIEWAIGAWMISYDSLKVIPDLLYRGLVLANRKSHVGRFAIVFNRRLYKAVAKKSGSAFFEVLRTAPFPELDDNPNLSDDEKAAIKGSLKEEMLSLNLMLEAALRDSTVTSLIDSEMHKKCRDNVCIATGGDSRFAYGPTKITCLVSEPCVELQCCTAAVYSFNTLTLVSLLAFKKANPYTEAPFDPKLLESLQKTYSVEIRMVKRAAEITD